MLLVLSVESRAADDTSLYNLVLHAFDAHHPCRVVRVCVCPSSEEGGGGTLTYTVTSEKPKSF